MTAAASVPVPRQQPPRAAMTLLEVIIATGILAMMMTLLMQSMISMRQFASYSDVQDDLLLESQKIVGEISTDLGSSGWYLPNGFSADYSTNERAMRYYPFVTVQFPGQLVGGTDIRGTMFTHFWRAPAQTTLTTPANITGQAAAGCSPLDWDNATLSDAQYANSHYARSQELIFLRVNARPYAPRPSQSPKMALDFGKTRDYSLLDQHYQYGIRRMSDYKRVTANYDSATDQHYIMRTAGSTSYRLNDIVPRSLWMRPSGSTLYDLSVPIMWETVRETPTIQAESGAIPAQIAPASLREYTYAVVPNPLSGRGQLVRAFRIETGMVTANDRVLSADAGSSVVVDEVISDYVDRITFDTYRSDRTDTLGMNQIRVRIFLSRQPGNGSLPLQTRTIEALVAMRTTTDSDTSGQLAAALGSGDFVLLE